jgi:predicted lipoprotein with Yx(FWY)xxD motif/cytochrome c5
MKINLRSFVGYCLVLTLISTVGIVMAACSSTASPTPISMPTSPTATASALSLNTMTNANLGTYLVDGKGMTLYYTTKDTPGQSNITGATLANWPVFYSSNIVIPSSLNAADFGSITRTDGSMQTTFRGYPLYYFIRDTAAGNTNGQGVGGIWFVVNPANFPPPTSPSPTTSPVSATPTYSPTASRTTPPAATTAAAIDAAAIYASSCAVCHGANRQGGVGPALNASSLGAISSANLASEIANGKTGTAMPSFSTQLSTAQINALVTFIMQP